MSKKELRQKTLDSMSKMYKSMKELESLWSENEELDFLANEYPFELSFDDLTVEVAHWLDYHKEYLFKK